MKTIFLLLLAALTFTACQKTDNIVPQTGPMKSPANVNAGTRTAGTDTVVKADTIPDNTAFRLKLSKDDANYDETLFMFKKASRSGYYAGEDAAYLQGFGQVSLSSISSDNKNLSIDGLAYTPGMSISLNVQTKTDDIFTLQISYKSKMPANMQVWLKDTLMKDSVNVCTGNYSFNVYKADTNSYGSKRFKLIIRTK